ncbi:MAG: DUF1549 domain-containing protein [Spirochaetia bacterium]|nr:DUF1549 domain-containing protein [Spirochaetia bacterium]
MKIIRPALIPASLLLLLTATFLFAAKPAKSSEPKAKDAEVMMAKSNKQAQAAEKREREIGYEKRHDGDYYPVLGVNRDESWRKRAPVAVAEILAASKAIDEAASVAQKQKRVRPLGVCDDETFLRRVTLDLGGRIPTLGEIENYSKDNSPDKRAHVVKRLLDSEDYVRRFYVFWAGLLRVQRFKSGQEDDAYPNWIKASLRDNMPYDEWVRRLVTVDGETTATNGPAGFILRDLEGGLLDHVSQVANVFLATQIGCAMCHNAKFEKWKQTDFYAFSAYFSQMTLTKDEGAYKKLRKEMSQTAATNERLAQKMKKEALDAPYLIADRTDRELRLPKDYKYDPDLADTPVKPAVLYGKAPVQAPDESRRTAFARWLTSPANPNFTRTIANRLWGQMMGLAVIEPVDDLNDANLPSSPEMLAALTNIMVRFKYDQKAFLAAIALSQTYQRDTAREHVDFEYFAFESHPLRRLSSEQLWDSLVTLRLGDRIAGFVSDTLREAESAPAKKQKGGKPAAVAMTMESSGGPSMLTREEMAAVKKEMGSVGGGEKGSAARAEAAEIRKTRDGLAFASDVSTPIPPGCFLDRFGMPLRDISSTGNIEPDLSQAITMMVGREVTQVAEGNAVNDLKKTLVKIAKPDDMLKTVSLATLGRSPTPAEVERFKKSASYKGKAEAVAEDLIWAYVNRRDFLFYR